MRGFFMYGLTTPNDPRYRERMRRFAGMYMNEDPEAPNYDPEKKLIRSFWNGSKGPMLHKATIYDWVGDPVAGSFHLMHSPEGRHKLVEMKSRFPKMMAHCTEYLDSVGDNPLNLAATALALNAYALTGEKKYRDWIAEYANAWKERVAACGGNFPTTVGLDGKPGSEHNGQWWKGTYGWNFTIFDGEIEKIAHRNYILLGAWPGFGNALLATGDQSYMDVLRRQMDNIFAQKKVAGGRTLYPQMYGDPRGYKYDGKPEWYQFTEDSNAGRLTELYLWSMDRRDLDRIPKTGWIGFLEGAEPDYPVKALEADLAHVRRMMEQVRNDYTTADSRLADYLLGMNPVATDGLLHLRRLFRGAHLDAALARALLRPRAAPRRTAGGRRRADREDVGRFGDADLGQREPGGSAHGHRAGGRVRRAPLRLRHRRRQDHAGGRAAGHGAPGSGRRRPSGIQNGALQEPAHAGPALGPRLVAGGVGCAPRHVGHASACPAIPLCLTVAAGRRVSGTGGRRRWTAGCSPGNPSPRR
jgi:hypothetical protein